MHSHLRPLLAHSEKYSTHSLNNKKEFLLFAFYIGLDWDLYHLLCLKIL